MIVWRIFLEGVSALASIIWLGYSQSAKHLLEPKLQHAWTKENVSSQNHVTSPRTLALLGSTYSSLVVWVTNFLPTWFTLKIRDKYPVVGSRLHLRKWYRCLLPGNISLFAYNTPYSFHLCFHLMFPPHTHTLLVYSFFIIFRGPSAKQFQLLFLNNNMKKQNSTLRE